MTQTDLSNIPIDIHANRLLDWLISRRHCAKDWPEKIESIRQKINEAMKDMPENAAIVKILAGASPINYFHCVKIVDVLKLTEAETKNIFGMYGSSRMKDWQDILKCYAKNNLYLAECASILARNVVYEIPALKRLNTKLEQSHTESLKKEASLKKQAQDSRDKFKNSCQQLGLEFDVPTTTSKLPSVASLGKQLTNRMMEELPSIFSNIADKAKLVREAAMHYKKFLKDIGATSSVEGDSDTLDLFLFVTERGNVTTYEWRHGEAPLRLEPPQLNYTFEEDEEPSDTALETQDIDFGDLAAGDLELETGEIDWGGIDIVAEDEQEIDFSIDDVETTGITVEEDGIEGGVARNEESLSLLENVETREEFINQIVELEGFLLQRIDEVRSQKPNEISLTMVDDTVTVKDLQAYLKSISQLLNMFNETKTKQFLLVRESKRYVIRIVESLLQNLKLSKKLDYLSEEAKGKTLQYAKEMEEIRPRIQTLTKQSRELQTELAREISIKYDNRPVYITGGV